MDRYIALLRSDPTELDLLAKDLLINVTSFFRDPKVFELLAKKIIPDLIANHASDQAIRIWIAGCSTGEETYSLAILLNEQISEARRGVKLQVLASDVDPDAIACARDGLYAESIKADVSPERLARYFVKEGHSYRVSPELRSSVVFTVHDVLADPPFSRLDIISCRNLLIYLLPEAQAKVISHFHFALRKDGILVLGSSEIRRKRRCAIRDNLEVGTRLSSRRPQLAGRNRFSCGRRIGRTRSCAFGTGPNAFAPGRAGRALPAYGDGELCARRGFDQQQV